MGDNIKVTGTRDQCTAEENINGQTENNTKANITWALNKATEVINGNKADDTQVNGKIIKDTVREVSNIQMGHKDKAYGRTIRE